MRGRTYAGHHLSDHNRTNRFYDMLCTTRGVLEGQGAHSGHMVAYDRGTSMTRTATSTPGSISIFAASSLSAPRIDAILLPKE